VCGPRNSKGVVDPADKRVTTSTPKLRLKFILNDVEFLLLCILADMLYGTQPIRPYYLIVIYQKHGDLRSIEQFQKLRKI
jgi:hypothetical protein